MTDMVDGTAGAARDANRTLVIQKVGAILDYIAQHRGIERSRTQMAADLQIPRGTLHRLLKDLEEERFLTRDETGYAVGSRVLALAAEVLNDRDILCLARPHLQRLSAQTGLNASLYVRMEECRVCVDRVEGPSILRPAVKIGELLPLHLGASGIILTAWLSEGLREDLLRRSRARFGRDGMRPGQDQLHRDAAWWAAVQQRGWVLSVGERDPELAALATPLFDVNRTVVASLSISGSTYQFSKKDPEAIAALLLDAAQRLGHMRA
ncbi:IclR family transcriptional regulator [Alicyclobacillus cycloheptanicus]|uniref:DNA-binding IclR family transcriptional regulator n=1 Tax=Alicyclobacillus cycloheptanicus TaxID=1457 RepID=A0ABT9XGF2_9BACL|nr:IclR family transcriptional regulator [Alicyclobacillus cycloheptanicus]MDQ0189381.1 DNA-binding IclR family transcriptional regulator [Alicyclobacillus cycloheptanicus]WDM02257.1 IclR family transcriptional regulator [Alicyclobacillus cycloheptanicus]